MKNSSHFFLTRISFVLVCLIPNALKAQFQGKVFEPRQDPQVYVNSSAIGGAWCGGINSAQLQMADLNQDGKADLVIYDNNQNQLIKTFLNTGMAGDIKYVYHPEYEINFPKCEDYLILKDYNCDGITDLFHKGLYGVAVYKGYYQNSQLKFNFYKHLFFPGVNGPVNVYVQPGDVPSITDIDNDGDIDVLAFDVLGSNLIYYKNMRAEDGLPCDSIRMVDFDNCWGKFYQGIYRTVVTGITCKGVSGSNKKERHTGNCILHLDYEGDGDMDLMGGNISFDDAQLVYNNKSVSGLDQIDVQDTLYSQNGHHLLMPSWPVPSYLDIDNDGAKDILFTSHADNLSTANYNAVAFFKNTGTNQFPNFAYQHDSLLTPDMIDVGTNSAPTFFDFDKDGKKDLFVGSEGYFNNTTKSLSSKLAYYRNVSTIGNVKFELISKDFLGLSSYNLKGLFPTFGDITGDTVADLVIGGVKGTVAVFKNMSASNSVQPNFQFLTDSIPGITVNHYSMPCILDFNEDGKTDLLLGSQAGTLAYYEDTSSTSTKKLALKTITIGNIKSGSAFQFFGFSAPYYGKMDNTGKDYLMVGNIDGNLERYDSVINNFNDFVRLDSNYSEVQTTARSVPAFDDLDQDGNVDLIVGNSLGGLYYYKQVIQVPVGLNASVNTEFNVSIFPNPVQASFTVTIRSPFIQNTIPYVMYDVTGRLVKNGNVQSDTNNTISIEDLPSGLYFLQLTSEAKTKVYKIQKQ